MPIRNRDTGAREGLEDHRSWRWVPEPRQKVNTCCVEYILSNAKNTSIVTYFRVCSPDVNFSIPASALAPCIPMSVNARPLCVGKNESEMSRHKRYICKKRFCSCSRNTLYRRIIQFLIRIKYSNPDQNVLCNIRACICSRSPGNNRAVPTAHIRAEPAEAASLWLYCSNGM